MLYFAVYKCQLCDETIRHAKLARYNDPKEVQYEELPELCEKIFLNQVYAGSSGGYKAPLQISHKCKDGNCGVAYFAGFVKE